ncbi:tetratricopeptide repeat protein [Croceicoccus gelatinilyticus]|uniref:tetratricopeptide repeat protein n=1 Tax=Croceicoccus gelatinilyticus TaxID=2835536 RepID=UPI001BCC2CD5|nr:hypothetical protein [Croceicoccus gelatinilyticus]MBS7671081.1 hypothetical protein [Croceicoccus gelatinilyticus]
MGRGASLSLEGDAPAPFAPMRNAGGSWKGALGILLLPAAAVAAVAVGEWSVSPESRIAVSERPALVPSDLRLALGYGPADHAAALASNAAAIALAKERVAKGPRQWLRQESRAAALMQRFGLTHDYADLKRASDVLDEAKASAPSGSGPWLRIASVAMMQHDLAKAERALDGAEALAVQPMRADRAEIAALRGDIALYRGDMAGAAEFYRASYAIDDASLQYYRRAILSRSQGRFDESRDLFAAASMTGDTPRMRAQIAMQIGRTESAEGRYASAAAWYRESESLFAGSPLGAALNAEALALAGDYDGGIAALEAAIETHQWPEMMDLLAMIHRVRGNRTESERWAARAEAIWQERLQQAPHAAQAHAAEHELAFGNPRKALQLARANLAARPYGEARILMANALIANGYPKQALNELRAAEREGWRSAQMFAAMAEAAAMSGDDAAMRDATVKAENINPKIFAPETRLAWFGHG